MTMTTNFETVARPTDVGYTRGVLSPLTKALLATLKNGQAIRVSANGRKQINIYASFYTSMKRMDNTVSIRMRKIDDEVTLYWLERKA